MLICAVAEINAKNNSSDNKKGCVARVIVARVSPTKSSHQSTGKTTSSSSIVEERNVRKEATNNNEEYFKIFVKGPLPENTVLYVDYL